MMRKEVALWFLPLVLLFVLEGLPCRWGPAKVEAAVAVGPASKLKWHFYYNQSCRYAEEYVKYQVKKFYDVDQTIVPKLLRLLYSDCFVTGCDASILLDGPSSEKEAPQNDGLGGFALIDKIKTVLEQRCPGVVSCADILNLATRDAVHLAGGPSYPVLTGRRDGLTSSKASVDLPSPSISWEAALKYFQSKGLNVLDLGTLLGAHSTGGAHCRYIRDRLYNFNNTGKPDPNMDTDYVATLRKVCGPSPVRGKPDPIVPLNSNSGSSTYQFNNTYYTRIQSHKAVLGIDQQLILGPDTQEIVEEFAAGFEDLRRSFALSMSRMGSIDVLTGDKGEIRRNCRYTNAGNPK